MTRLLLFVFILPLNLFAQNSAKTVNMEIPKGWTVSPKDFKEDYSVKLEQKEAPFPSGENAKQHIHDLKVQNNLIQKVAKLNNPGIDDKTLQRLFDINEFTNSSVGMKNDLPRNIDWKLKYIEFDNMFSYGKKNKIDFEIIEPQKRKIVKKSYANNFLK